MTLIARWLVVLAALITFAVPAYADDIAASARGVVRVVTIAVVDDQVVGFGHGSGFAVAPNRIVTNAHVVELAKRYPANVVIGVVPSEGAKSYEAKVIAIDSARDLALVEFTGAPLPTLALYSGPVQEGDGVTALGYPGNVDVATAQSAADYIHPLTPIRSEGVFSGRRQLSGIDVLLHTAGIARGNSGGPLLDRCGRVIGVNSAITQGEQGDSNFGFAIADSALTQFLAAAKQRYAAVGLPCTSMAERMKQDSDADARAAADAASAKRDADSRAQFAREERLAHARDEAERDRENVIALAAVLLVAGALALGGAGLFETRRKRRAAIWSLVGGWVLIVAAGAIFFLRPSGEPVLPPDTVPTPAASTMPDVALGKLSCAVVPERSRIVSSAVDSVDFDWGAHGCVNGRTQYAQDGGRWSRALLPADEQTVTLATFDPATRDYVTTRYFLGADDMDKLRELGSQVTTKACSTDTSALAALAQQQAAIRAALPPQANEKIVYTCQPSK